MGPDAEQPSPSPSQWLAWIGAAVLWLLLSFGSLDVERDEGAAYVAGALVGRALATLAIACLARWLYVLARGRDRPFWSPWVLVIAAGIALVVSLAQLGERARSEQAAVEPRFAVYFSRRGCALAAGDGAGARRVAEPPVRDQVGVSEKHGLGRRREPC